MYFPPKDNLPDHPFRRFVTHLNEQKATWEILEKLRQNSAILLNLLLFCCWFATAGQGRLTKSDIQELIKIIAAWHERILPALSQLNDNCKKADLSDPLKQEILTSLKFAENIEQMMLTDVPIKFTRHSRTPQQKLTDACKNIVLYCKTQQIHIDTTLSEILFQLLANIFPKIDLLETQKIWKSILTNEASPYSQKMLDF
jgi:hypothetical protein